MIQHIWSNSSLADQRNHHIWVLYSTLHRTAIDIRHLLSVRIIYASPIQGSWIATFNNMLELHRSLHQSVSLLQNKSIKFWWFYPVKCLLDSFAATHWTKQTTIDKKTDARGYQSTVQCIMFCTRQQHLPITRLDAFNVHGTTVKLLTLKALLVSTESIDANLD